MERISPLAPEQLSDEQRQVYDAIASGPRKGVRGPLAVWLHRPRLAACAQALGQYCRYDSSVPSRLSELVILSMGRHWLAEYEWAAHKPFALEAGLSIDVIDAIRDGIEPPFVRDDERLVHAFVKQLHERHEIDDALYAALVDTLGEGAVVDLVGIAGYYTLISMTIKVFNVPPPAGVAPELPATHG
ncbi:carboxymuconolactone decarboxylase [Burkholderia multivorans]|uniref:carboxymuconolactone decarboxylase family protein n=1 Tax=Burkholderia multivorans TaxID=87883 RepID=UPI000CFE517E|nr:carboxymuconolactone decarboxylase [Burkholderia multivorans]MBU9294406.1 carboxymuconolactone decarboxylase family protein [Burkholderia multivorans]PRE65517.1 carboxymuconolactone decarboxylase [Burkholderia multivorans]PRF15274.1 carboxymuconolactone decarboxylase [Burkholderia multivorans]